jgi:putative PEP-CTERM system TPR-repeat lipoprotein
MDESTAALQAGKPRTAEIHLKNLLQQEPNNTDARAMLGQVALRTGDPATAEHNLRQALELGSDAAQLQIPLLQALLSQGKHAELLEQAGSGPRLEGPDAVTVLTLEGAAHRGLGNFEEAEAAYRQALAIGPSGEIQAELAAVVFAAGRPADALELISEALAANPDLVAALVVRASIEQATARYGAAEATFKRALEIENERRNGRDYAIALAGLIETQLAARKLADAAVNADALLALQPQGVQAHYLKAAVDMEQGALDAAEARLETLIGNAPRHWPSYTLLGLIKSRQNQLGQAEMYLRQATSGNPADVGSRLLLAEVYLKQNNVAAVRELVDPSAAGNGLFLALAGRMSQEAGQASLAAEFFTLSEQNAPGSIVELGEIVAVYVGGGEIDRAIRMLESASFEGAENDRAAVYMLTLVQLRQGNAAAAAEVAARLGDQDPASLNLRGTLALLGNDAAGARGFFARATELAPRYVPAWLNLARAATVQNDLDRAAEHLRRVLEIEPSQLNALFALAQLAVRRGDFAEAEGWVARMPESALRYQAAGQLYSAQRRFEEAYDAYSLAFERAPAGDVAVRVFIAARAAGRPQPEAVLLRWLASNPNDVEVNFALGTWSIDAGDLAVATQRFEAALANDAKHAPTLNNLAWLYDQRGDPRALEYAQRAYDVAPSNPAIADTLGWLYVSRGDAARGLPLLEQATNAVPTQPEIRYHFAVALDEAGQDVRAAEVLAELLASSAEFSGRAEAEERHARLQSPR